MQDLFFRTVRGASAQTASPDPCQSSPLFYRHCPASPAEEVTSQVSNAPAIASAAEAAELVRAGLGLLAELAAEIYSRSLPPDDDDGDAAFEDRAVKLAATFQGAAVLSGDLTPECASVVTTVLDALSAPTGAEDDRSHAQRYHDAL